MLHSLLYCVGSKVTRMHMRVHGIPGTLHNPYICGIQKQLLDGVYITDTLLSVQLHSNLAGFGRQKIPHCIIWYLPGRPKPYEAIIALACHIA